MAESTHDEYEMSIDIVYSEKDFLERSKQRARVAIAIVKVRFRDVLLLQRIDAVFVHATNDE